jgi:hypothetical protein
MFIKKFYEGELLKVSRSTQIGAEMRARPTASAALPVLTALASRNHPAMRYILSGPLIAELFSLMSSAAPTIRPRRHHVSLSASLLDVIARSIHRSRIGFCRRALSAANWMPPVSMSCITCSTRQLADACESSNVTNATTATASQNKAAQHGGARDRRGIQ